MSDPYSLLIKWIGHHKVRSYSQIAAACKSLANDFNMITAYPLRTIFSPLYRIGLIEFCGDGSYRLGPPVAILNETARNLTVLNPSEEQRLSLSNQFNIQESLFNLINFPYTHKNDLIKLKQVRVPIVKSQIKGMLAELPSVKNIVQNFEQVQLTRDSYLFFDLEVFNWQQQYQDNAIGICKADEIAQVFYFVDKDKSVYRIPSARHNPDSYLIALCYQASLLSSSYIQHCPTTGKLDVDRIRLPVIIERILRLPSIYQTDIGMIGENARQFNHISSAEFRIVQRILNLHQLHE
jgi:hypothetical protein